MVAVCKDRDASSLYPPMVLANMINCFCWVVYGLLAINDPIIYSQNAAGLGLQFMNFLLILLFPRTRANEIAKREAEMINTKKQLNNELKKTKNFDQGDDPSSVPSSSLISTSA